MSLLALATVALVAYGLGRLLYRAYLRKVLLLALNRFERNDTWYRDAYDSPEPEPRRERSRAIPDEHTPVEITTFGDPEPQYICPRSTNDPCSDCVDDVTSRLVNERIKHSVGEITEAEIDYVRRFAREDARTHLTRTRSTR